MAATDKPLLRAQNTPAPQYFNKKANQYEVIEGRDGANSFIEKGRIVKEVISGSANVTKAYGSPMFGFAITNDGLADLTFTINSLTITVKPGESFDDLFEPFNGVVINATDAFRSVVRE